MIDNALTSAIIGNRREEYDDAAANVKGIVGVAAHGVRLIPTDCFLAHGVRLIPTDCILAHGVRLIPTDCILAHGVRLIPTDCFFGAWRAPDSDRLLFGRMACA